MERRSFIKGLLAAVTGGEAIVRLATPSEARTLALGEPAFVGQPQFLTPGIQTGVPDLMTPEIFMREPHTGKMVMVGYLTSLNVKTSIMDATTHEGEFRVDIRGMQKMIGTFEGFR